MDGIDRTDPIDRIDGMVGTARLKGYALLDFHSEAVYANTGRVTVHKHLLNQRPHHCFGQIKNLLLLLNESFEDCIFILL